MLDNNSFFSLTSEVERSNKYSIKSSTNCSLVAGVLSHIFAGVAFSPKWKILTSTDPRSSSSYIRSQVKGPPISVSNDVVRESEYPREKIKLTSQKAGTAQQDKFKISC